MKFNNIVSKMVWNDRYRKNGETLEEHFTRVANAVGKTQQEKDRLYELMDKGYFYPAGRVMSNSGLGTKLTVNNCYVLPMVEDDMDSIFDSVKISAKTHQAGGGVGVCVSALRPRGTPTSNDAIASGPISFMHVFNAQTETISQGSRRGALMGVLSVYHPDIEEFITAKSYEEKILDHFNLSVMVDDEFMKAVENDEEITLRWPIYDEFSQKTSPDKWKIKRTVKANDIWNKIMRHAYDNGEPGILFEDTMNSYNNTWYIEHIVGTNPCGEYIAGTVSGRHPKTGELLDPSQYGGACNLGSLFLHNFVKNPFTKEAVFDFETFGSVIWDAVKFLDNIVDINKFPNPVYENYQKNFRTIGLGVTGLADTFAMVGVRYDSEEAVYFADYLMDFFASNVYRASIELAKENGPFEFFDAEKYIQSEFIQTHLKNNPHMWEPVVDGIKKYGIRNARMISVAPTGTISLVYGNNCSSGIEPIFQKSYQRKIHVGGQDDKNIEIVNISDYAYAVYKETHKDDGGDLFETALDIPVEAHLNMLATIAKHTDAAVSKTINIPTEYTFEQTKDVYMKAWKSHIKGCTIFRPNPIRQGVLIADSGNKDDIKKSDNTPKWGDVLPCTNDLVIKKRKLMTGCGSLHVLAGFDKETGDLRETYFNKGSTGGCSLFTTGLSRTISLLGRAGVSVEKIKDQMDSTGACPSYAVRRATKKDTSPGACCPMAIGNALVDMHKEVMQELKDIVRTDKKKENCEECIDVQTVNVTVPKDICPECGEPLDTEGGCNICRSCGYTKCG